MREGVYESSAHLLQDPELTGLTHSPFLVADGPAEEGKFSDTNNLSFFTIERTGVDWTHFFHGFSTSRAMASVLNVLIPSFLRARDGSKAKRLQPTAYLDGVRGVAALVVAIWHFIEPLYPGMTWGWGSERDGVIQYGIFQAPIISTLWHGRPMVGVFFVVSGFALAYKPSGLVRKGNREQLLDNLSSSVFRRLIRLFLPCLVSTFFMAYAAQMGWWTKDSPGAEKTLMAQYSAWFQSARDLLDIFRWNTWGNGHFPRYDPHLWTIPLEFRGSMVVFAVTLGLARLRARWRLFFQVVLTSWCFYNKRWDVYLFLSGMVLAELHHRRMEQDLGQDMGMTCSSIRRSHNPLVSRPVIRLIWYITLVVAMYILSIPDQHPAASPYFTWLVNLMPTEWQGNGDADLWFIHAPGSVLLLLAIMNLERVQSIFTAKLPQYLGRISFALYIVHGPVMYMWRIPVEEFAWTWIGRETGVQYATAVLFVAIVLFPPIFCLADMFWRLVDAKSVALASWLLGKVS